MQSTVITVPKGTLVAKVSLLSPQQAQFLQPISPELINEHVNESINEHIATSDYPEMGFPSLDTFWFPTPETCENPEALTGIANAYLMKYLS